MFISAAIDFKIGNTVMTILVIVASIAFISSLWTGGDQNLSMFTPTQLKLLGIDKNGVMAPESTRKIPQTIVEKYDFMHAC